MAFTPDHEMENTKINLILQVLDKLTSSLLLPTQDQSKTTFVYCVSLDALRLFTQVP